MVVCATRRSPLVCTVPAERSNAVYRAREANHMHVMTHANGRAPKTGQWKTDETGTLRFLG